MESDTDSEVACDMILSLKVKLSMAFALVAMLSVFLISILANFLVEKQFREYIIQKHENRNREIESEINQQYAAEGKWKTDVIENIGINALEEGLIIKVKDSGGKIIWDATRHNNGLCMQMLAHLTHNMTSRYPNWQGGYKENSYLLTYNLNEIGKVEIGYYGPFYFNDNDLYFINTLNRALILVAVIALLFSLLFGILMSRKLSLPILKVIGTARMIEKGRYSSRSEEKTTTKEIQELVSTINNLAGTLETQEKLRKRLTTDVAHELRTPMATLQSHMEAMIDGIWQPTVERLKSCHEEIIRINKMVGDLGMLAKYEGENLVLNKSYFDVSELVSNIVMNFESEFKSKGVQISFNGEKEMMLADRDKISQVIINLVSNGLKYTPEGGSVQINIKGAEDITEICVKDSGQGIPEEDLPYIFERFYRADKSRNRMMGGSGIGLSIAKAIIEAHNGTISVQSKVNDGTEFIVSLCK